jgi:hypothetical protein
MGTTFLLNRNSLLSNLGAYMCCGVGESRGSNFPSRHTTGTSTTNNPKHKTPPLAAVHQKPWQHLYCSHVGGHHRCRAFHSSVVEESLACAFLFDWLVCGWLQTSRPCSSCDCLGLLGYAAGNFRASQIQQHICALAKFSPCQLVWPLILAQLGEQVLFLFFFPHVLPFSSSNGADVKNGRSQPTASQG